MRATPAMLVLVAGFWVFSPAQTIGQIDPQLGLNDFRIDPVLASGAQAGHTGVAYDHHLDRFLVAWEDRAFNNALAQFVASDGSAIGDLITLYDSIGSDPHSHQNYNVTYDGVARQFLVTFQSPMHGSILSVVVDEFGGVAGPNEVADACFNPSCHHDVVFIPDTGEYLVAWWRETADVVIRGRRLNPEGLALGPSELVLASGSPNYPTEVALTYNTTDNEVLLVWRGPDDRILGRRLEPDGTPIAGEFGVSGPNSVPGALWPDLAYNPLDNEYLVVWAEGFALTQGGTDIEVFGQRLSALGSEVGVDDLQISTMGRNSASLSGRAPSVAFNPVRGQFLVIWNGDEIRGNLVNNELEVFGHYIDRSGQLLPPHDFRISELGPPSDPDFGVVESSKVVYSAARDEFLAVFFGDHLVQFEDHVYGQRLHGAPAVFLDGFETGDTQRWASSP